MRIFKIVVIGDPGVGKSAMLLRLSSGIFEAELPSTIGVDFHTKTMRMNNETVKLTIWDTAGQERFRTLTSSYYRNSNGIVLVYDVSCKESFDHLQEWMDEIDTHVVRQQMCILLIGNKIDIKQRQISIEEANMYARTQAMAYMETSAKTDEGIWPAFQSLVANILMTTPTSTTAPTSDVGSVLLQTAERAERYGCC